MYNLRIDFSRADAQWAAVSFKKEAVAASIGCIEQTLLDHHVSGSVCVGRHIVKSSRLLPDYRSFLPEKNG